MNRAKCDSSDVMVDLRSCAFDTLSSCIARFVAAAIRLSLDSTFSRHSPKPSEFRREQTYQWQNESATLSADREGRNRASLLQKLCATSCTCFDCKAHGASNNRFTRRPIVSLITYSLRINVGIYDYYASVYLTHCPTDPRSCFPFEV